MEIELYGRSREPRRTKSAQAFSVLSSTGTSAGLQLNTRGLRSWRTYEGHDPCERLWLVSTAVSEVVRLAENPVEPLSSAVIAANPNRTNRSALHLRIDASHTSGSTEYRIDLGQSFEIYAGQIHMELLGPPDSAESSGAAPASGLVADTLVTVRMLEIEVARGHTASLTETLFVTRDTAAIGHPVPPGARALTIQTEPPVRTLVGSWWRGRPPTDGVQIGDFIVPPNGRSQYARIPAPQATHMTFAPGIIGRVITLVWEIVP